MGFKRPLVRIQSLGPNVREPHGCEPRGFSPQCRCSSMVECQLPKLNTRVRFPSPAPKSETPQSLLYQRIAGFLFSYLPLKQFCKAWAKQSENYILVSQMSVKGGRKATVPTTSSVSWHSAMPERSFLRADTTKYPFSRPRGVATDVSRLIFLQTLGREPIAPQWY